MLSNFGLFDIGTPELIIILVILLLLFGSKKLPELSKSIGESLKELRKGASGNIESDQKTNKVSKEKQDTSE